MVCTTNIYTFSKTFILGDISQSDLKNGNRGGFESLCFKLNDQESRDNGIYTFSFTYEDILRSKLVKFLVKKLSIIS